MKPLALALALAAPLGAGAQPVPALVAVDAPQAAPPLPFRYVGRIEQNGKTEVLLLRGALLYSAGAGDEIEGEYRIERITRAAIHFTFLPAQVRQDLDLTMARR